MAEWKGKESSQYLNSELNSSKVFVNSNTRGHKRILLSQGLLVNQKLQLWKPASSRALWPQWAWFFWNAGPQLSQSREPQGWAAADHFCVALIITSWLSFFPSFYCYRPVIKYGPNYLLIWRDSFFSYLVREEITVLLF